MDNIEEILKKHPSPETLAQAFLIDYFGERQATYPINPFQILTDIGVPFVFRPFKKFEGVYFPPEDENDIPVVGINLNRPITRQRFTAAHELCHHIKDRQKGMVCPFGSKSIIETYAEKFAAELLMPLDALKQQVDLFKKDGYVSYDDVLMIAHYFGVSFESCLFRIAYKVQAIQGDTDPNKLKKSIKKFAPETKRTAVGLDNIYLYEGLFEAAKDNLRVAPSPNISYKFQNEYVYNDSRMEGINIEIETSADIVADIRIKKQESEFCSSDYKEIVEVAGHAVMYNEVFEKASKANVSIYDSLLLNGKLFSCAPYPEYGGRFRDTNTLVIGAKFETFDKKDIPNAFAMLERDVRCLEDNKANMSIAIYIEKVVELHHRMTVIHPFPDGNGRTSRAFLNLLLIRNGIPPVYFKVDYKDEYFDALSFADKTNNYVLLFEVFFRAILRTHSELTSSPLL